MVVITSASELHRFARPEPQTPTNIRGRINQLSQRPKLDPTEESELIGYIQQEGVVGDLAKNALAKCYKKMVFFIAGKFKGGMLSQDELISEAYFGLYEAIKKVATCNIERFSAYAARVMTNTILGAISKQARRQACSLDAPLFNEPDGTSLHEQVADETALSPEDTATAHNAYNAFLSALSPQEKMILELYFVEEMTCAEIGAQISLHPDTVGKIINQAIAYLREIAAGSRKLISYEEPKSLGERFQEQIKAWEAKPCEAPASVEAVAAKLGVVTSTLRRWQEKEPQLKTMLSKYLKDINTSLLLEDFNQHVQRWKAAPLAAPVTLRGICHELGVEKTTLKARRNNYPELDNVIQIYLREIIRLRFATYIRGWKADPTMAPITIRDIAKRLHLAPSNLKRMAECDPLIKEAINAYLNDINVALILEKLVQHIEVWKANPVIAPTQVKLIATALDVSETVLVKYRLTEPKVTKAVAAYLSEIYKIKLELALAEWKKDPKTAPTTKEDILTRIGIPASVGYKVKDRYPELSKLINQYLAEINRLLILAELDQMVKVWLRQPTLAPVTMVAIAEQIGMTPQAFVICLSKSQKARQFVDTYLEAVLRLKLELGITEWQIEPATAPNTQEEVGERLGLSACTLSLRKDRFPELNRLLQQYLEGINSV